MNIRSLRVAQMVSIARHLVGPARATLMALPGGAVFVAQIEGFLQTVTAPSSAMAADIAALDAQLQVLDFLHDRLLRGSFLCLGGLAELADDEGQAKALRAVQQRLFPDGLSSVNRSYLEEAAFAEGARNRLVAGDAECLRQIVLPGGGTLDEVVTRWGETGQALRETDNERAELRAADKRLGIVKLGEARRQFGRAMSHLVSTLDFHGASAEVREKLLSKLMEAIEAAESRQRRQAAGEQVESSEDDVLPLVEAAPT